MTEAKSQPFDNLSDEHALALEKAYQSAFNMSMAIMPPASPDRWHRAWRGALIATLNKAAELGIVAAPRPGVSTSDIAAELESVVWRLTDRYRDVVPDDAVLLDNVRYRSSPDQPNLELIATVPNEYGPAVRARLHGAPAGISIGYGAKPADYKPDGHYPEDDRVTVVLECIIKDSRKTPTKFPDKGRATCEVSRHVFDDANAGPGANRAMVMDSLKRERLLTLAEFGYLDPTFENERWSYYRPTGPLGEAPITRSLERQTPTLLDW